MEIRARYVLIGLFTLAVILAGFGFVYWLNHAGGVGERSVYRVRFETPVSGLSLGSDVLFNGVRVGEVTDLRLNTSEPSEVMATIAIAATTPIRADTHVALAYGGLTGTASISLSGGTASLSIPRSADSQPPLLTADPAASGDWTSAARDAFGEADKVLTDNADALHGAIANIGTVADALARNSGKIDGIVAGLVRLTGGGAAAPATIYDLQAPTQFEPGLTVPTEQLAVALPTAVVSLNTQRFLLGSDETIRLVFDDARWSDAIPAMFQAKIIQAFENAGYLRVGGDIQGFASDRQLVTDIRAFRISDATPANAEVAFSAKIVDSGGKVLAARLFSSSAPVDKIEAPAAADALNQAFGEAVKALVVWAMQIP